MTHYKLDDSFLSALANPITKKSADLKDFKKLPSEVVDARVFMPNTYGYRVWEEGQECFEDWEKNSDYYNNKVQAYKDEIVYDAPVYERFPLSGKILDIGGGAGILRQFIPNGSDLVSLDPFEDPVKACPPPKRDAYQCLNAPLNFICGNAEFVPFVEDTFDIVHMRSMLDHVHGPDLAVMEAKRVLKDSGFLLIGMSIEGDENGKLSLQELAKELARFLLVKIGFEKFKDHHLWHPSLPSLNKILTDNGFTPVDIYFQPYWKGRVVYIKAIKTK